MRKIAHYRRNNHPNSGLKEKICWQLSKGSMTGRELSALFNIPLKVLNTNIRECIAKPVKTMQIIATNPVAVGKATDYTYTLAKKPCRVVPAQRNDCRVSYKQMAGRSEETRQQCIAAAKRRARLIKAGINPGCLE